MSFNAILTLERLVCLAESDHRNTSHSEPYIWPYLFVVSGDGLMSTPTVAEASQSRRILRSEMKANEAVQLPPNGNNRFTVQFDDGPFNRMLLVVALLEADELPTDSAQAGYQTFLTQLDLQLRQNFQRLFSADEAERADIVKDIKNAVSGKVYDAIRGSLSFSEKAAVWWGSLNPDDFIAADHWYIERIIPTQYTLGFRGVSGDETSFDVLQAVEFPVNFLLDCRLEAPDPDNIHVPLRDGQNEPREG